MYHDHMLHVSYRIHVSVFKRSGVPILSKASIAVRKRLKKENGNTIHVVFLVIGCLFLISASRTSGTMAQRSDSIDIRNLQDIRTPFGVPLSGIYKRSFAYKTIKDRLPVILTKVIDILSRDKDQLVQNYGQNATDEIKSIVGFISKLKNGVATNKALTPLDLLPDIPENDAAEWNKYLEYRTEIEGGTPTWFNTAWLYCECYMYRTLAQEILKMKALYCYDPFEKQKQSALINSLTSISGLSSYVLNLAKTAEFRSIPDKKQELHKLLKLNLWGNKCDLSLSAGAEVSQSSNPMIALQSLDKDILIDNSNVIWNLLSGPNKAEIVDIVLDNAGYELFTDLCLAVFLTAHNLTHKIRFYVKRYPWYISDVTTKDIQWTLDYMSNSLSLELQELAKLASSNLANNTWTIEDNTYWTSPYDYADMKEHGKELYTKLSQAKLAIFKGDLNYRKLVGDINWEYTTNFTTALRGFQPTNILSIRTVKSDVCVGLASGIAEDLFEKDEDWMFTGQYGLIQTSMLSDCHC